MPLLSKRIGWLEGSVRPSDVLPSVDSEDGEESMVALNDRMKKRLMPVCLREPLFCILYRPLLELRSSVSLSPVEVWLEAQNLASQLGESPRPDLHLISLMAGLQQRYRCMIGPDNCCLEQNEECVRNTCCIVLTTLLYMIVAHEHVVENLILKKTCITLLIGVKDIPLYRTFYEKVYQNEEEEQQMGNSVKNKDFMQVKTLDFLSEKVPASIGELMEMVEEYHDPMILQWFLLLLYEYNTKHQHRFDREVKVLAEKLKTLNQTAYEPKHVGTYIDIGTNHGPVQGDVREQQILLTNPGTNPLIEKK